MFLRELGNAGFSPVQDADSPALFLVSEQPGLQALQIGLESQVEGGAEGEMSGSGEREKKTKRRSSGWCVERKQAKRSEVWQTRGRGARRGDKRRKGSVRGRYCLGTLRICGGKRLTRKGRTVSRVESPRKVRKMPRFACPKSAKMHADASSKSAKLHGHPSLINANMQT